MNAHAPKVPHTAWGPHSTHRPITCSPHMPCVVKSLAQNSHKLLAAPRHSARKYPPPTTTHHTSRLFKFSGRPDPLHICISQFSCHQLAITCPTIAFGTLVTQRRGYSLPQPQARSTCAAQHPLSSILAALVPSPPTFRGQPFTSHARSRQRHPLAAVPSSCRAVCQMLPPLATDVAGCLSWQKRRLAGHQQPNASGHATTQDPGPASRTIDGPSR